MQSKVIFDRDEEGKRFTDSYGQQSCTAGRAAFITGQSPYRTGLTKVGMPGVDIGLQAEDATIAELLKPLGYATGQFGKNHFGEKYPFLEAAKANQQLESGKVNGNVVLVA